MSYDLDERSLVDPSVEDRLKAIEKRLDTLEYCKAESSDTSACLGILFLIGIGVVTFFTYMGYLDYILYLKQLHGIIK